ncbi:MAG: 4,5-dihydroxyphthalate decarboxylase, partial [Klenkia sp.]|nr:4,5-dihydroxyphthalate decarboxylase [Klenkia sp.]
MTAPVFTTVTRTSGPTAAVKDGSVRPATFEFAFEEVPVLPQAFRRMVRTQEFDISEMALTTYLVAKEHGVPITGIPVFLVRAFHHGAIQVLAGSGVREPADLVGRRVGVHRGYTVTTGVWARDVLLREHGIDPRWITWVLSGDEHVEQYTPPGNVEPLPSGTTLEDQLRAGELAAVIGADLRTPDIVPLIPDALDAGLRALDQRGSWPINHLLVVRDDVLAARPGLAVEVFEVFSEAKRRWLEELRAGTPTRETRDDRVYRAVLDRTGTDPLPYGIKPNRAVLHDLVRTAVDQQILTRPAPLETVF